MALVLLMIASFKASGGIILVLNWLTVNHFDTRLLHSVTIADSNFSLSLKIASTSHLFATSLTEPTIAVINHPCSTDLISNRNAENISPTASGLIA